MLSCKDGEFKMILKIKSYIFEEVLGSALGLDKYQEILAEDKSFTIAFRRKFIAYFRVRRNKKWQDAYFGLFQDLSEKDDVSFSHIIRELFNLTGQVEPSFSSKMLHILNPDMPIWDQHVLKSMKIDSRLKGSPENKINQAIENYKILIRNYKDFLDSKEGKKFIHEFDHKLQSFRSISDLKKVDAFIWKLRNNE